MGAPSDLRVFYHRHFDFLTRRFRSPGYDRGTTGAVIPLLVFEYDMAIDGANVAAATTNSNVASFLSVMPNTVEAHPLQQSSRHGHPTTSVDVR
ncbi:hypothetical protein FS749_004235 [Ceratobasidium sp. UAMH 11750]|nr:hypothetical protein FS749_004235 [Ceratobasidium sp. UAMH 11750]